MKAIVFLINIIYWLGIFISPAAIFCFVALWLYSNHTIGLVIAIAIGIAGVALGIVLAEYVRKKYGLQNFFGGVYLTPDINEDDKK